MNPKLLRHALILLAFFMGSFTGLAQSITGFSPAFGAPGELIIISGSGFTGVTSVKFAQNIPATGGVTADNQIQVYVPAGAVTGPITITKGTSTVSTITNFTVIGNEPYITGWTPSSGAPGQSVTIRGVHFTGVTNVSFNGTRATSVGITSDTQIQVTSLPAGITTGKISLTRYGLTGISSSNFYVAPVITSFSPANGRPGTNVVIKGQNFVDAFTVTLNGVPLPSFTVNSNSQITFTVPSPAGTGPIAVIAPGGQAITTSNFLMQPTISGFSPTMGKQGTNVIITGQNLNGTTAVSFNGTSASFGSVSSNQVTAIVPMSASTGPITLTTTNGSMTTSSNFYLPPIVSGFNPATGGLGAVVKISGYNFSNTTEVAFNGTSASFSVLNNNTIDATVPLGASSGPIFVTAPAGTAKSDGYFWLPPSVSSLAPASGVAGMAVTITGTSLTNASAVLFNGANASFTVSNNSQITATVPTNATTGPVSVVTPGGTAVSAQPFVVDLLKLSIQQITNGPIVISWTTNAVGFSLQSNTNLNSLTNWVAVTNSPVVVAGKNTVTNSPANNATFYRLKQ